LSVAKRGGIPQEANQPDFYRFLRQEKGRGWSDDMCSELSARMCGLIELESNDGSGTTFRIWLRCTNASRACWSGENHLKKTNAKRKDAMGIDTLISDCTSVAALLLLTPEINCG